MSVLDQEPTDVLLDWWHRSKNMKLISQVDGRIEAANSAFLDWINYTIYEFTRADKPVTWFDLTMRDDSFEADREMAIRCMDGTVEHYSIRKYYIPKGESPKLVELSVMRYPRVGEFKAFLVDVQPIVATEAVFVEALGVIQKDTGTILKEIRDNNTLKTLLDWISNNKTYSIPLIVLFSVLLFGRSVIEIFEKFWRE